MGAVPGDTFFDRRRSPALACLFGVIAEAVHLIQEFDE